MCLIQPFPPPPPHSTPTHILYAYTAGAKLMYMKTYNIQDTETYLHKITNVPAFYMALGLNDFDGGKSITRAIGRGGS